MATQSCPNISVQRREFTPGQRRSLDLMDKYTELEHKAQLQYATKMHIGQQRLIYFTDSQGIVRHMIKAELMALQVSTKEGLVRAMYQFLENKVTTVYYLKDHKVRTVSVPIPANFFGIVVDVQPYRPLFHYSNTDYLAELQLSIDAGGAEG